MTKKIDETQLIKDFHKGMNYAEIALELKCSIGTDSLYTPLTNSIRFIPVISISIYSFSLNYSLNFEPS
ncbi:unnamed protein product [marine sediment metagenome]|uniref:Uncharacterized protein n=1 Tax=marine sediment metagenome TaxID=412755 RepID=X1CLL2_9ZZZZ